MAISSEQFSLTGQQPDAAGCEREPRRIRALLEAGQFAEALTAARAVLADVPTHRDALYMLAIALRYLGREPEALSTLARLQQTHAGYPRLYQERGHCHVALQAALPAMEAFAEAVKRSPALIGSWRALHSLYRFTGRRSDAEHAAAELRRLEQLPPDIVTAYTLYADDELREAERLLRQYLLAHGAHAEGMRLLAQIGVRMDAAEDAEILLERVVASKPDYDAARYDYAAVLLKRHRYGQAREQLNILLAKGPSNPTYRALLASVYTGFGDHEKALPLYRQLVAETPGDAALHLSVAHALKSVGQTPAAIESYRAAAAARPHYGEAYWSLANLKTYGFSDTEVAQMRRDEASPIVNAEDRVHLCFAVGKALEDRNAHAESFAYYARGNALKKAECGYQPEPLERNARLQAHVCTREFFEARHGWGSDSPAPIFIVGLPRSGSTLLEQILASHSRVEGTMELPDVPRLVQGLQERAAKRPAPGYPELLPDLDAADFTALGEDYLAVTHFYRRGKEFFIDKMPNNFRHIGLIHLMLPKARIIDARREPMACCFSNYKQLFASGQPFTYGIEDIARYYRMYVQLMAHWDAALPGRILKVQHEDVVNDLEKSVRRTLDYCELEFEPACIEFHKTRRTVHTASSEQVRRPLNREGLDQWRHFEPWLGPLKTALES